MREHIRSLLNRVTIKYQLNPSSWIPHPTADGLFSQGERVIMIDHDAEVPEGFEVRFPLSEGKVAARQIEPVYIPEFNLYGAFWTVCYGRRKKEYGVREDGLARGKSSLWEELWSFLFDVSMGMYDTTNWGPPMSREEIEKRMEEEGWEKAEVTTKPEETKRDWVADPAMSAEETMERFEKLGPEPTANAWNWGGTDMTPKKEPLGWPDDMPPPDLSR